MSKQQTLRDVMTKDPATLPAGATVREAAHRGAPASS